MKKIVFLLLTIALIFSGCKKDDEEKQKTVAEEARDGFYSLMQTYYLWNDKMPEVNPGDYADPYELLEAIRYTDYDKWSFVADYDEFVAEMSGSFVGHGIRIGLDANNLARIVTIYNGSDLYAAGVRRGWIIKTINDIELAPILIAADVTAYNNLMGASTAGIENAFVFENPQGAEVPVTSTKASFTINTVLDYDTLHLSSGITGYLAFDSFLSNSPAELEEAFSYFKACAVTDIVVDLRYNTGGYLDVAQLLSSYIAGNGYSSTKWIDMCYNASISDTENKTFNFTTTDYPLNLTRAFFITTGSSASASEVVISSLMPYLDVKLVGAKSYGKPCGMDVYQYGTVYIMAPVTFEYKNSLGFGEFYGGIPVDVEASDDITHDFGDRNEASLAAAIALIEGDAPVKSASEAIIHPEIFNEGSKSKANLLINTVNTIGE